jgi:hypothetical protein
VNDSAEGTFLDGARLRLRRPVTLGARAIGEMEVGAPR